MQNSHRRSPAFEPHAFGIVGIWQPGDRWTFPAKWKYASGVPTAHHSLSVRADRRRRLGPLSLVAYPDILNVYGRENGDASGWGERRGVSIIEGLDEALHHRAQDRTLKDARRMSRSLKQPNEIAHHRR